MLELWFENKKLDIGKLQGISLQKTSSFLEFENLQGSYSIPFSIPRTEVNNLSLGFKYVSDANKEAVKGSALIKHSGLIIAEGTLEAKTFENNGISCNFYVENGSLFNKVKDKELPEFDYGGDISWINDRETEHYTLPYIVNQSFYEEGAGWSKYNQNYDISLNPNKSYVTTPCLRLHKVIKAFFVNLGYVIDNSFFEQTEYKDLLIYSNTNVLNYQFVGSNIEYFYDTFNYKDHVPWITAKDFILSLQNYFNIYFDINSNRIKIIDRKEAFLTTQFINISDKVNSKYVKTLKELPSGFILHVEKDKTDAHCNAIEDISSYPEIYFETPENPIVGWLDYPNAENQVAFTLLYIAISRALTSQLNGKQVEFYSWIPLQYDDPLYSGIDRGYFPRVISSLFKDGKGITLPIKISSIADNRDNTGDATVSYVETQGNYFGVIKNKLRTLRLMIADTYIANDNIYHIAWAKRYYPGTSDFAVSPVWSYFERLRDFIRWYSEARKAEYQFELSFTPGEIKNFDFSKKYKIGNHLYFIKSFSVDFTLTGVKPAKCICVRI